MRIIIICEGYLSSVALEKSKEEMVVYASDYIAGMNYNIIILSVAYDVCFIGCLTALLEKPIF